MSEISFREYRTISFGYYKDHYCIDKNGELLYDCYDEDIAKELYNYLKKLSTVTLFDVEVFFRFLYENSEHSEHYQFYHSSHIALMHSYSNEEIKSC